jgi:hypothetical protein
MNALELIRLMLAEGENWLRDDVARHAFRSAVAFGLNAAAFYGPPAAAPVCDTLLANELADVAETCLADYGRDTSDV